ncbi:YhgE/Pip domain-containing protein [Lactococcus ileimucosae]|uniref:YhgE/Pip domain-containing protein n=1 Tax=Lactococcus ileimucosae TaxID=2941329 RepID=A0ABV4D373_9LACT
MKHIKNTGKLFILDWKRIFKNPIAIFLVLALMFIPSLYAWFNIKALWDPYANTSQLPIAVYSDDRTEKFQDKSINIGDEVLKNLKKNKQLGWKFVHSKQELDKGVKSGKYYAGIYLPEDFSKNLLSFTTGDIQKPKIVYSINEKINAIAPKITSKGATSLQSQISEEFVKTASSTLLKTFNDIGYDIDKNMVSIQKIKNIILSTNDNLDTIDQYTQQVVDLHDKMPDLKAKLDKANEFIDYLPEVDALGQKVVQLDDSMPMIKNQLSIIMTLQAKIPEIQNAGKQLAMIDNDFASVEQTMNEGIQEAKQGLTIIQQVQTALPDIRKLGDQANELASTTLDGATQLQNALPSITNSLNITLKALQNFAHSTSAYVKAIRAALNNNHLSPEEKIAAIQNFQDNIKQQENIVKNLITFLENTQASTGNHNFDSAIQKLKLYSEALIKLDGRLETLKTAIANGEAIDIDQALSEVETLANNLSALIDNIDVDAVSASLNKILTQLIATIKNAQGLLTKAQAIDFESLLNSTSKTVSNAIALLEKYQKELPAIKQEVHDANLMLNGNMNTIISAINKGASLYQNELPLVEQKLDKAADFVKNDYPAIRKELTETLGTINEKMPDLEKALDQANDLIINDWPSIKTGIRKAADAIHKGEKEVDLGEIVKLLKLDATKESDFLAQPVEVQENAIYPIANNGSASTPFYTALCLWVGAVLFSSVAVTEFYLKGNDKKLYSKREQFAARMLTFIVMGIGQALIVTLGNYFGLGVDVHNPVYSVLFALLIALSFMIMVYVLVALFGNIGKGIAIIILVLSISGGGGNYPIQVSGKFFQAINPYLPFTHAVNLLRESAGGIYWPNAWLDIIILVAVGIGFLVAGLVFFPHLEKTSKKISEMAQKSHIFH